MNKYLFLAQVVYLAKYDKCLFKDDFKAYVNGPVIENATYEELIEITHEDPEWIRLNDNTWNVPIMNIENNKEEYKKRYKGLIEALKL